MIETNKKSVKKKTAKKYLTFFSFLIIFSVFLTAFLIHSKNQKELEKNLVQETSQNFGLLVSSLNEASDLKEKIDTYSNSDPQIFENVKKQIKVVETALEISKKQIERLRIVKETSPSKKNVRLAEKMISFYQETEAVYSNYLDYLQYFDGFNELSFQIAGLFQAEEADPEDLIELGETIAEKLALITPPVGLEKFHQNLILENQALRENPESYESESPDSMNYEEEIEVIYENLRQRIEAVNTKAKELKLLLIKEQTALKLEPFSINIKSWK